MANERVQQTRDSFVALKLLATPPGPPDPFSRFSAHTPDGRSQKQGATHSVAPCMPRTWTLVAPCGSLPRQLDRIESEDRLLY